MNSTCWATDSWAAATWQDGSWMEDAPTASAGPVPSVNSVQPVRPLSPGRAA